MGYYILAICCALTVIGVGFGLRYADSKLGLLKEDSDRGLTIIGWGVTALVIIALSAVSIVKP
jgi:hypothetical protein